MKTKIDVNNLACAACVHEITGELIKINGVFGVEADIAAQQLTVDHTPDVSEESIKDSLKTMGYLDSEAEDRFAERAADWDANIARVIGAEKFARLVMESEPLTEQSSVLDFGCGTGLVGLQFAPYVGRLLMVDNSPAMLEKLTEKVEGQGIENVSVFQTLDQIEAASVDGIVSLMAFHHVEDTELALNQMYECLKPNGFVVIGDLVKEDGDFHSEAVPHNGFDENLLREQFKNAGFRVTRYEIFNSITKETVNGEKTFPQFMVIAKK